MVHRPDGYHLTDYVKIGIPLTLLVGILVIYLVPLWWEC